MIITEDASVAGRALRMVSDLIRMGRMSDAEAQTVYDLVHHPDLPESLHRSLPRGGTAIDASGSRSSERAFPAPKDPSASRLDCVSARRPPSLAP